MVGTGGQIPGALCCPGATPAGPRSPERVSGVLVAHRELPGHGIVEF